MGDVHFDKFQDLDANPFIATGVIETDYRAVRMFVGVLQLESEGSDTITGAAYGMGATNSHSRGNGSDAWSMCLQHDTQEGRKLKNGPAIGFVLAELPGGQLTGWIDRGVQLAGAEPPSNGSLGDPNVFLANLPAADRKSLEKALAKR